MSKKSSQLPFSFEKAEHSSGFLLWQVTTIWQRLIKKALEEYNITHSQFVIMATLLWFEAKNYATTQISIINWTKLDKMTVSHTVKKLAAQGLVTRIEDPSDSRAKVVTLTDAGKKLTFKLVPKIEQTDHHFFGKISVQEQKQLLLILSKLVSSSPE
jgi:MarR family transcriptional regulator, organic hydroperoxide resistance regulator